MTDGAARISLGLADKLKLGNLDARRDWGFAGDYVRAMWLMLQQDSPADFVIATGTNHSVRELCELAFKLVGLDYQEYVETDEVNLRPSDVLDLRGDASRAKQALGWEPTVGVRRADPDDGRGGCRAPQGEPANRRTTRVAMRALVIGADGFAGRWLTRHLIESGDSVVAGVGPRFTGSTP